MPSSGVVTSWSHNPGTSAPNLKLKVLRPVGGSTFDLVGESSLTATTANQVNTLPIRIPVLGGDLIAAFFGPGPNPLCGFTTTGAPENELRSTVGDVTGTSIAFPTLNTNAKLSLSVNLEPDADNDGFGDETQDLCPSRASTQGACPKPARITKVTVTGPARVKRGRNATYKVRIFNTGGQTAAGVRIRVSGKGLKGTGSAGAIAAGKSKTVRVRLRPTSPGRVRATFKVTSANAGTRLARKSLTVKR
jgi:hypothetical protein